MSMHKYELYIICFNLKETTKTIYTKNPLTDKEKRKLYLKFADEISEKTHSKILLCGCEELT